MENPDQAQESKRTAVQTSGVLLVFIGLLLVTVGLIDFISSSGYGEGTGVAWVALLGLPIGALGLWLLQRGLRR